MNKYIYGLLSLTIVLAAVTFSISVQAQSQGYEIEEVVVTARQREENLTDVPASITAFTEGVIERASIQRAEDFIALTPGVSLTDTAEVGDAQVSIRGINGTRDAEANFAFIVDGILHTNPSAFNREFADLQQIEVLKGPQGAIYGRSASAGAILVSTQKPTQEFEAGIKASAGNRESYYVSAHASGGLGDNLAGRIHIDYRDTQGFYKNTNVSANPGTNIVDDFENYNINGRLLWEPNEDLDVDFRAHYGEVEAASITFNASFGLDVFGFIPPGAPLFENVNHHPFVFQSNIDPENDQESLDFSIKADYDMDWGTLTGWFLYSDIEQSFLADGTSGAFGLFSSDPVCQQTAASTAVSDPLPAPQSNPGNLSDTSTFFGPYTPTTCDGAQYQERNQEDYSFEIRLTSPGDQQLRWQAGVYYLNLEREVGVATVTDPGENLIAGTRAQRSLTGPDIEALVYDGFDTEVFAVFGQIAYDLVDDLEFSAALRYDNEKRKVHSLVPSPAQQTSRYIDYTDAFMVFPLGLFPCPGLGDGPGSPLNPAYVDFDTCTINQAIPDRKKTFEELQPKLSLRWNANDNWTFFGSWGVGFKSGGFNNQGSQALVDLFFNSPLLDPVAAGGTGLGAQLAISDQFKEETSNAFEVGFKSQWADGRISLEGAAYHTLVDDMQVFNFLVGPFGLLRVVSNIDEASITGFEAMLNVQFTDALKLYGGGAVTNAKIDKNSNRPQTAGNRIPYAPEYTFNFGAEFIKPTGFLDGVDFTSRVDYTAVGPTWFASTQAGDHTPTLFTGLNFGLMNHRLSQRDSYGLINLRAGLQSGAWGIHGVVKNLLDENYLAEVIPAPEFGGSFIHPSDGRSWAVEVGYQF